MDFNVKLTQECDHQAYDYVTHDFKYFEAKNCPICKGLWEYPSETGEELLDFLRKHFK